MQWFEDLYAGEMRAACLRRRLPRQGLEGGIRATGAVGEMRHVFWQFFGHGMYLSLECHAAIAPCLK